MAKSRKTTKFPENTVRHADWLALIDISGGFLDADILNEKCGSGLDRLPLPVVQQTAQFYAEWRKAGDTHDVELAEYHRAWLDAVYYNLLGYERRDFVFFPSAVCGAYPTVNNSLEGPDGARFVATSAMMREGKIAFYIRECEPDQNLDEIPQDGWNLSLTERMARLCRKNQVCLGLLTNGEQWRVVYSPADIHESASHATWYARIWSQERETMHAFAMFMGVRRAFGSADDRIEALIDASRKQQKSVSDTLETQVAHAIETLIRCLDRADIDRNRKLLAGVSEREVYEAALTVMMRLVFILCAEERKLLLDNELYNAHYAATTLREQLLADQAELGDAVLEIRHDAWTRLLALFRAIYGGIRYEDMRMPPLGGTLFDPDKYPFLEGRGNSTSWRNTPANPLPIDNRTVLLLLNSLQILYRRTGAQTISYKTLGIEQIGHVYEGLLELTVIRAKETMIGTAYLNPDDKDKTKKFITSSTTVDGVNIALEELERRVFDGDDPAKVLKKMTGKRDTDRFRSALHRVCNTQELYRRIEPCLDYIRADAWGEPCVIYPGSFMLVAGTDRRETGAHYTPRFLTEQIVATTLEPLVYEGPKTGTPREQWRVRSAAELLDLRICDPAMGSGAFLVQACRYLGERLVEAWKQAESLGMKVTDTGAVVAALDGADPMTANEEERLTQARRLIAERCLYGVDINPLAVELAKLSIWLVTLSKGRPFCFLDHQLKCGDSLVGVHDTRQIVNLNMTPDAPMSASFFKADIERAVEEACTLRKQIQATRVISIDDIDAMRNLHDKAQSAMQRARLLADAMCGIAMREAKNATKLDNALGSLKNMAGNLLNGDVEQFEYERQKAQSDLDSGLPAGKPPRRTFHWALEFPEVFDAERGGFDAICGNPPFMGGQHLTGNFGTNYRDYLVAFLADNTSGSADLVAYFYLRAASLLKSGGCFGLLATDTIAQGDTRQVGLERMVQNGITIYDAMPSMKWPGKGASLNVAIVHVCKGDDYRGTRRLNGKEVDHISAFLSDTEEYSPQKLPENADQSYIGSYILGTGWLMSEQKARDYIAHDAKNAEVLYPYLGGDDLNSTPDQRATRWVINFFDWPLARDAQGSWRTLDAKAREKAIKSGHVPADYPNRVAEDFPELLQIVREKVKPERDKLGNNNSTSRQRREHWWLYGANSIGLYHAIGRGAMFALHPMGWNSDLSPRPPLPKGEGECGTSTQPQNYKYVLATVLVTKYFAPSFVENNNVFNHKTCIITINEYNKYALLNSSIINIWVWKTSSRNNVSLNFSPSDSYETLPFPEHYDGALEGLGHELEEARRAVIGDLTGAKSCGLTAVYNLYHDPSEKGELVERLRDIHRRIDEAVCRSYGWDDIALNHGFYETEGLPANDCIRYTISPDAQREVLKRLFALNKSRAEAAKAAKSTTPAPKGRGGRAAKPKASDGQGNLF